MQDAMKIAEDKVKLFLLQSALLKKLPLKYRAHAVKSSLLDEFCKAKDGKVYPFHEVSKLNFFNLTLRGLHVMILPVLWKQVLRFTTA